jgi:hypothetical protein
MSTEVNHSILEPEGALQGYYFGKGGNGSSAGTGATPQSRAGVLGD